LHFLIYLAGVDAKFWIDVWFDDDPPKQRRRQYRPQATKFALFFFVFLREVREDDLCDGDLTRLYLIFGGEESTKSVVAETEGKRRSLRCLLRFL